MTALSALAKSCLFGPSDGDPKWTWVVHAAVCVSAWGFLLLICHLVLSSGPPGFPSGRLDGTEGVGW